MWGQSIYACMTWAQHKHLWIVNCSTILYRSNLVKVCRSNHTVHTLFVRSRCCSFPELFVGDGRMLAGCVSCWKLTAANTRCCLQINDGISPWSPLFAVCSWQWAEGVWGHVLAWTQGLLNNNRAGRLETHCKYWGTLPAPTKCNALPHIKYYSSISNGN